MPESLSVSALVAYAGCIAELRVDNFGAMGSRLLMGAIGIGEVSLHFVERIVHGRPQFSVAPTSRTGPMQPRIYSYAEYEIVHPVCFHGALAYENGLQVAEDGSKVACRPRWLRAITLPINAYVERELCAEFQLLEDLCNLFASKSSSRLAFSLLDETARLQVSGTVHLLVTGSSCVSCLGAIRQFQLLWPNVGLFVGMVRNGTISPTKRPRPLRNERENIQQ